jgi:hypothetical protein
VADRRYNAKLILPEGTEPPSLIVYYPPTLTGEEVEDIGRQILAVFTGQVLSDVEDEEGRGTTTEDMLDAGLLDSAGVPEFDSGLGEPPKEEAFPKPGTLGVDSVDGGKNG